MTSVVSLLYPRPSYSGAPAKTSQGKPFATESELRKTTPKAPSRSSTTDAGVLENANAHASLGRSTLAMILAPQWRKLGLR